MNRIEFTGGWLVLKEPAEITIMDRRRISAARSEVNSTLIELFRLQEAELAELNLPEGGSATREQITDVNGRAYRKLEVDAETHVKLLSLNDTTLAAAVDTWSLPQPITVASIQSLPLPLFDAITAVSSEATNAILRNLYVDFSLNDPDPASPDPIGA